MNTNQSYATKIPTINLDHLVGRWDVWERMLKKIDPEAEADGFIAPSEYANEFLLLMKDRLIMGRMVDG